MPQCLQGASARITAQLQLVAGLPQSRRRKKEMRPAAAGVRRRPTTAHEKRLAWAAAEACLTLEEVTNPTECSKSGEISMTSVDCRELAGESQKVLLQNRGFVGELEQA
jgi:hypothetical protein